MRILIATGRKPDSLDTAKVFFADLRKAARDNELEAGPFLWVEGPGCSNLAFDLKGDVKIAEAFAVSLTMALMPAKWSETSDKLPTDDTVILNGVN